MDRGSPRLFKLRSVSLSGTETLRASEDVDEGGETVGFAVASPSLAEVSSSVSSEDIVRESPNVRREGRRGRESVIALT